MKKLLLLFVMMLLPVMASAFEGKVEIKGICYHIITKGKKAKVVNLKNGKYLGNVIIPSTVSYDGVVCDVTSIGDNAFSRCAGLTSVTIPNSVTSIGSEAFAYCTKLTSVKIPNSVTNIGSGAFFNCKGLTTVTIPNSVRRIVEYAFSSCSDLTDVYCYIENLSNADVDHWVFSNSYLEYTTLHVPKASLEAYKKKEPWSGFGKIVPIERPAGGESDAKSISDEKLEAIKENVRFKIKSESNVETTESEILTLKNTDENPSEYAKSNSKVFDVVEQMPSFPGGPSAMFEYLSKNNSIRLMLRRTVSRDVLT